MQPFGYVRALDIETAIVNATHYDNSAFIAGGTGIVDLMQDDAQQPQLLIDINPLPLATITSNSQGVRIGSMTRNSDVAEHPLIRDRYPALSDALSYTATPQLRNMATVGGNLLQRTRCPYFRDVAFPCSKRRPSSGCPAINGINRSHAILGTSDACIATHASDMAVALTVLDAIIHTQGANGERRIPIGDFYVLPGDTPDRETVLEPGELILAVELPNSRLASHYFKSPTDNFALASVAIAIKLEHGVVQAVRIALGGVATKPWRAIAAEAILINAELTEPTMHHAAAAMVQEAIPRQYNGFKVELIQRMLVYALLQMRETP